MSQCYTAQELEEINRSILTSMVSAQSTIIGLLTKFKPGTTKIMVAVCKCSLIRVYNHHRLAHQDFDYCWQVCVIGGRKWNFKIRHQNCVRFFQFGHYLGVVISSGLTVFAKFLMVYTRSFQHLVIGDPQKRSKTQFGDQYSTIMIRVLATQM